MREEPERKKNAIIILNGISLKKKLFYHEYLPFISRIFNVEVHETLSKNDAVSLASKFTDRYAEVILAAGGDGTIHQVVNGVLKGRESARNLPVLGVIPIGSSNDFARGAGMKVNTADTLAVLAAFKPKKIDVGTIEFSVQPGSDAQEQAYFVNVADIGMGPEVVRRVLNSGRPFGSEVAYYKSILHTFLTYKPMVVKASSNDWTWQGKIRSLAVANGKFYGHGLCIAPDALLDDRKFVTFICGNVSVLAFIANVSKLKNGKHVFIDDVLYKSTAAVELTSERPCAIEGDGEILGWLPARVKVTERQLQFLI